MQINRRTFINSASAGAALGVAMQSFADWEPSTRYPDVRVRIVDPSFTKYRIATSKVERLATGMRWCEGPVWFGDGRYLLWSDIPNNCMMRWDEEAGAVSVFRKPSNNANGNTRDRQGRLLTCEHNNRRVVRTEYDGTITVIADSFDGKPLNSPNDIVCKSDGSIWFTDPPFGILGYYEGHVDKVESPTNVYRWDPQTKKLSVVAGDINRPNGLAFSPDESKLYIIEAGTSPRVIRVYNITEQGRAISQPQALITAEKNGTPDGMRVDIDGNLWCGWGMGSDELDGVRIFNPDGKLIGQIDLPERCANLCFGGLHLNRLFMCASTSLYSLFVNTQGVAIV